ncbi:hypothetical protein [Mesobacterium pallidum]|uniref:hypothetical protein n=1 Tax=Mesobacterium pallidum TaxID=2872037 RepID=UPI001EE33844|nr:hypothetical protein [Mesobacterium pallidum]
MTLILRDIFGVATTTRLRAASPLTGMAHDRAPCGPVCGQAGNTRRVRIDLAQCPAFASIVVVCDAPPAFARSAPTAQPGAA